MGRFAHAGSNSGASLSSNTMFLCEETLDGPIVVTRIFIEVLKPPVTTAGNRFVIYQNNTLLWESGPQTWENALKSRQIAVPNVEVGAGFLRWGAKMGDWGVASQTGYVEDGAVAGHRILFYNGHSAPPQTISGPSVRSGRGVAGYIEYADNQAPLKGSWMFPPAGTTPSGATGPTPTFQGTLPHPDGDQSAQLNLRVYRESDSAMLHNEVTAVTDAERAQGYFSRSPVTLPENVRHKADFRHYDPEGAVGPFSDATSFINADLPAAPSLLSPTGKLDSISGFDYSFRHEAHPDGLAANGYQIRVYNAQGSGAPLYDSGVQALGAPVPVGGTITAPEFHADLAWDTPYSWIAAVHDANGNFGPFAPLASFRTNARPVAPTSLTPSGGKKLDTRLFQCLVSDPDGDEVTEAQMELVDAQTGQRVPNSSGGAYHPMTVSGGTASATLAASLFVNNRAYRWAARASDGGASGFGAFSAYADFVYASVPGVAFVSPAPQRTNLLLDPSAEYGADAWALSAGVSRVEDGDAASGFVAWEGTTTGATTRTSIAQRRPVDATKAHLCTAMFQRSSETSNSRLRVLCYDAANVLLGEVSPSSLRGIDGVNVAGSWTRYGGIVWPSGSANAPKLPAGTAQVDVVANPNWDHASVVRVDDVQFERVPTLAAGEWLEAQKWFGYFDGDETGYGEDLYGWAGEPGDSASSGIPVTTGPTPEVRFSYSSSVGNAKKNDRLLIDRWAEGATGRGWQRVHEPAFRNSADPYLYLPVGVVKNEGRYRMKVQANDAFDNLGETDWLQFDVRLVGPPPLRILSVSSDPLAATISVTFESSALPAIEFAGVEVALEAADGSEPRASLLLSGDPNLGAFTYHFPVSGTEYALMVRQWANAGVEQVQGPWSRARASVEYPGFYFVKDAADPAALWVKYQVPRDSLRAVGGEPEEVVHMPWGAEKPVTYTRRARPRDGTLEIRFLRDLPGQTLAEGWRNVAELERSRGTVCLLSHRPHTDKVFAKMAGRAEFYSHAPKLPAFSVAWRENGYSEDRETREGIS